MIKNSISIAIIIIGVFMMAPASFATMPEVCTQEYAPVCGQPPMPECPAGTMCAQVMPEPQTYSNTCMMQQDGAMFVHNGECANGSVPTVDVQPYQMISSPLNINGNSNGAWHGFEGNLGTVEVQNDAGDVLAVAGLLITGEWMTEDPVNFSAIVEFDAGDAIQGKLVFKNANPSNNRELDKSFEVPVQFDQMIDMIIPSETVEPPSGCVMWFDGCNTCTSVDGEVAMACTEMACMEQSTPYCIEYAPKTNGFLGLLNRMWSFITGLL